MKTIFAIASLTLLLAACGEPQSANLTGVSCPAIAQEGCAPGGATDVKLVAQAPAER